MSEDEFVPIIFVIMTLILHNEIGCLYRIDVICEHVTIPWLVKTFCLHFIEKKSGIAIQALY